MAIAAPEVDVIEFERGKPPAKPIDPITARVIAGALDSAGITDLGAGDPMTYVADTAN